MLSGKRIAMLVANGFEESEMTVPYLTLKEAGAVVHLIAPDGQAVKSWDHQKWGTSFPVDRTLTEMMPEDIDKYDAVVIPGGVMSPDKLRINEKAVTMIKRFVFTGKPLAAICHGPWLLVEADAVRGKTVTSWPSLRTDLENAGGEWVDLEVVVSGNLITSRKPNDLPAFVKTIIEELTHPHGMRMPMPKRSDKNLFS